MAIKLAPQDKEVPIILYAIYHNHDSLQRFDTFFKVSEVISLLDHSGPTPDQCDRFLLMHSTVIHPQHSLMLDVRHTLSLLLGHCEGHLMADLTEKQLQLKEETGRMLCRVADVLIPGIQLFD